LDEAKAMDSMIEEERKKSAASTGGGGYNMWGWAKKGNK